MPTYTSHYSWQKPDLGASNNTWGATQNGALDAVDQQVFANSQAGVPIGTILMWGGNAAPTAAQAPGGWLICNGQSLSTTGTYAALFAVCGTAFNQSGDAAGTFRVPNLVSRFPTGANGASGWGVVGGAASVTLDSTMIPAHTHTTMAHSHSDNGHQHPINLTQTTHSHTASQAPHSHAVINGAGVISGFGLTPGGNEFQLSSPTTDVQTPSVTVNPTNANVGITARNGNGAAGWSDIGNASLTSATVTVNANTGGGGAHENRPPFVTINFIIRYA